MTAFVGVLIDSISVKSTCGTIKFSDKMEAMRLSLLILFFSTPLWVFAQSPSVDSFTVSPTTINSGAPVYFNWTLSNAGGYSLTPLCASGVKFKSQSGSEYACDSAAKSSTVETSGSFTLYVANTSGSTRTAQVRLTPKNSSGQDDTSVSKTVSFSVATDPEPITSFTSNVSKTEPGVAVTISWTSRDLTGVNLKLECRSEIKVSSPSYTQAAFLPCDKVIFSTDLAASGSLTLNFTNSSVSAIPYKLTLLPAFAAGAYDGTHAKTLVLDIASDIPPDPLVKSFFASSTTIYSGEEVKFAWEIQNAKGANLQLSCVSGLTATSSRDPAAILPCGKPAFSEDLSAAGSLTFSFIHKEGSRRQISVLLLPAKKAGEYDALLGKSIAINVDPPKASPPSPPPAPTPPPPPPAVTPPAPTIETSGVEEPKTPKVGAKTPVEVKTPGVDEKTSGVEESLVPPPTKEPQLEIPPTMLEDAKLTQEEKESLLLITGRVERNISRKLLLEEVIDLVERATPASINPETREFETYEITGKKKVRILFFIPVKMRITVEVTKDGEIKNIRKPWWGFLAR